MRQLTIRYLARDGRTKTMCYFNEVEPGVWQLVGQEPGRDARRRLAQAMPLMPKDVNDLTAAFDALDRMPRRPPVSATDSDVTFHGYFTIPWFKLRPLLSAFAERGEREVDISTLRLAVNHGKL